MKKMNDVNLHVLILVTRICISFFIKKL